MRLQLPDLSQQTTWEDVQKFANQAFDQVSAFLNGNISLSDNIDCQLVTVVFVSANGELTIAHKLKRVPVGYILYNLGAATTVYNGATAWTKTNLYLKATVATTVKMLVF